MEAARQLGVAPTIFLGLRLITHTFVYGDLDHPSRATQMIESPAFTPEDQALLMGLDLYESDLCHGCGHPRSVAWHSEMDGWFEAQEYVCHACTAKAPERDGKQEPVVYAHTHDTRPDTAAPLPPFVLGETTSSP